MSADGGQETVEVTRADWEAMQRRMERLERAAGVSVGGSTASPASTDGRGDGRTDRRGLLRHGALLAAGAAAAGAVAVVSQAAPAEAATGSNLLLGEGNSAGAPTAVEVDGNGLAFGIAVTDNGLGAIPAGSSGAIFGHSKNQGWPQGVSGYGEGAATGVAGLSDTGVGVLGSTAGGGASAVLGDAAGANSIGVFGLGTAIGTYGVQARGVRAALYISPNEAGPPLQRSDFHQSGEIDADLVNVTWLCVASGSPGSWVRLGATGSAGALSVLPSSVRVYDSRSGQAPTSIGPKTPLSSGVARAVDMTANSSGVPSEANAVLINLTAVPRSTSGFVAAYKFDIRYPGTSTLNWSAAGNPVANSAVVATESGKINLITNASTDVVVDVIGYYQ